MAITDLTVVELARLRAAVELHRPTLYNKHGRPTDRVEDAKHIRCGECGRSVPAEGCTTWRTAHPDSANI